MRLGFVSTKTGGPWGGSEELWSESALELLHRGHQVAVGYPRFSTTPSRLLEIRRAGGVVWELDRKPKKGRIARWFARRPQRWLERFRPELVLISLHSHTADLAPASWCLDNRVPYAVLFQVAHRQRWISPKKVEETRRTLLGAAACYFVSEENRCIVEDQVAARIDRAKIVEQSFGVSPQVAESWPGDGPPWRLATVGRIHFRSKAQDVVIDVLRREKWRERPLEVGFWGGDQSNERQLRRLIELHGLQRQAKLAGFTDDVERLWAEHHALLLPSRYEGSARVLLEAMVCWRPAIVTAVGRANELVDDGETGFVAEAPVPDLVDRALERAWSRRAEWRSMGRLAGRRIRERCSMHPASDLADEIELQVAAARQPGETPG